jgi:fused signal recognition particle receptor
MDELHKIIRVLKKVDPDAPHETLLVLDATVGRNALAQENIFGHGPVSGQVMTKLDGTARGRFWSPWQGLRRPIKRSASAGIDDLQPFDARAFQDLVGLED